MPADSGALPRLTGGAVRGRASRPRAAKPSIGWATPRDPVAPGAEAASEGATSAANAVLSAEEVYAALLSELRTTATAQDEPPPAASAPANDLDAPLSIENALETLEMVLCESDASSENSGRRTALLEELKRRRAAEEQQREQARLASIEHMINTIHLLNDELEKARSSIEAAPAGLMTPTLPSIQISSRGQNDPSTQDDDDERDHNRRGILSPRLYDSPLRARSHKLLGNNEAASARSSALAKRAEQRLAARQSSSPESSSNMPSSPSAIAASSFELLSSIDSIASREEKLRTLIGECGHWQREYAQMRDKVVEEKTRQVALFRRLDDARREHLSQISTLEAALRGAHTEVELLRTQFAQARSTAGQLQQRADEIARRAWEEKQTLVCSIAETRHKFKEWKEGEAATLKAARDQAVHNLKTEYELKIARHHEEKQKLRDKVKDLEVSLRLLQRDRHMSAVELSQRKSTILGTGKDGMPPLLPVSPVPSSSGMAGTTAEAELIEAQSRIKELEALLEYAKEYQKRQDNVIKVSEETITRLMQERDVVALENLSFESAASVRGGIAVASSLYNDNTEYAGYALRKPREPTSSRSRRPSVVTTGSQQKGSMLGFSTSSGAISGASVSSMGTGGVETLLGRSNQPTSVPPTPLLASTTLGTSSKTSIGDPEKEILRRQSVILTAEIEKYRQLVVHSMDEIRSLKDQRRRSHQSLVATANGALGVITAKEQYLMSELLKAQVEVGELKRRLAAKKRSGSNRGRKGSFFDESEEGDGSGSENSDGSNSDSSGDSCSSSDDESNSGDSNSNSRTRLKHDSSDSQSDTNQDPVPFLVCQQDNSDSDNDAYNELSPTSDGPVPETSNAQSITVSAPLVIDKLTVDPTASGAIQVIQKQGKVFLARRAFIKKKLAIEKIKARYRGYLVRKNLEMLGCDVLPMLPRPVRPGGPANAVSEAAQYKMRVVPVHFETVCDCQGHVFKVLIRVSKDPSLVQMQMLPSTQNASQRHLQSNETPEETHAVTFSRTASRIAYFHLFEVIAALPYEEETLILEHTSEREIAAVVASLLRVVRISGEYKCMIDRNIGAKAQTPASRMEFGYSLAIPQTGTLLTELPVDPMLPVSAKLRAGPASERENLDDEAEGRPPEESRDLDCLIRDARLPPEEEVLPADASHLPVATGEVRLRESRSSGNLTARQLRRLSLSSLGVIPER